MTYSKHKDASPEDTIHRIKECFASVGITLEHTVTKRMEHIYSSVVIDPVGGWSTAGKGTTEGYCLASAYAEAMEHFCNYCAYDVSQIRQSDKQYLGFNRYPDETVIPISQIQNIDPQVLQEIRLAYSMEGDACDDVKLAKTWEEFLNTDTISLVPYYSVKKKSTVKLPEAIIGKLCGSTGGGAGNTAEEAIGHALDEISERYAKYVIYSKKLTPPEISHNYVREVCPDIFQVIENIQKDNRYSVLVLDASLGRGYPVVAVCLIDRLFHSYVVNFGAHPCFSIAMERCFTEMFQFMTLGQAQSIKHKNMEKWTSFSKSEDIHSVRNWVSLLRDDTGKISDAFFAGEPSWKFVPWGIYSDYSNRFGMKLQIDNFLRDGVEDIYIRDFSFLGFPVYRIYIPEYSTSHYTVCDRILKNYKDGKRIIESIVSDDKLDIKPEELAALEEVFSPESYVDSWIIRDIKESYQDLLYAFLVKDKAGTDAAVELIANLEEDVAQAIFEEQHMMALNRSVADRDRVIKLFYGEFILNVVVAWRDEHSFVRLCMLLKNQNLLAPKRTRNNTEKLQLLHKHFKELMVRNTPDQMRIKTIVE